MRHTYRKVRARAPLRLGLAGGGTDLPEYSEEFGGAVLNVTLARHAHVSLSLIEEDRLLLEANDIGRTDEVAVEGFALGEGLSLHRAVYDRIARDFFDGNRPGIHLQTMIDAPPGSGLGSSSALVVAMVEAFRVAFDLPLGQHDVAKLAYDIERRDLGLSGGRQDQYAAAFGGVNFIEFQPGEHVIVNPLRLRTSAANELMSSLVTCFTGQSRASHQIIVDQTANVTRGNKPALEGMHRLKEDAHFMKAALLAGDIEGMARILDRSWAAKKATAPSISNFNIDRLWTIAHEAGALAGKVSGAGGGGFLMFIVPPPRRASLMKLLREAGAEPDVVNFSNEGAEGWVVRP